MQFSKAPRLRKEETLLPFIVVVWQHNSPNSPHFLHSILFKKQQKPEWPVTV